MFQRNKSRASVSGSVEESSEEAVDGKGRPTPSRREAETARKQRMKQPLTRKQANKINRRRRGDERAKAREAMQTGDERYLPARDRGPVRRLCRDLVDSRYNVAEFLLPILIVILVLSIVNAPWAVTAVYVVWMVTILAAALDAVVLVRKVRKELKSRFPDTSTRGATAYTVLRSTQLRRFRLPKPQIGRGEALPARY